jgi:replication factor C subunit 2/4
MNEEEIEFEEGGLEALLFTADGDMRYALNNLQATVAGFGKVSKEYVYRGGESRSDFQ